jgi:hypothetical protein
MAPPTYALRGLSETGGRLDRAAPGSDNEAVLVALSEHLHWLYALGEWWKSQLTEKVYFAVRDADTDGRAAGALAWARGFLTHELIGAGEQRPLYPGEDVYPNEHLLLGNFWRWRSLAPRSDKRGRDEMYRERVAHRDLVGPLDEAARFLTEGIAQHHDPTSPT